MLDLSTYNSDLKIIKQINPIIYGAFKYYAEVELELCLYNTIPMDAYKYDRDDAIFVYLDGISYFHSLHHDILIDACINSYNIGNIFIEGKNDVDIHDFYNMGRRFANGEFITQDEINKEHKVRMLLPYKIDTIKDITNENRMFLFIDNDGLLRLKFEKNNDFGIAKYAIKKNLDYIAPRIIKAYEYNH